MFPEGESYSNPNERSNKEPFYLQLTMNSAINAVEQG
jgi:hypothetical protein